MYQYLIISQFVVLYKSNCHVKALIIKCPEITRHVKNYHGDKYLAITNNEKNISVSLKDKNIWKKSKLY